MAVPHLPNRDQRRQRITDHRQAAGRQTTPGEAPPVQKAAPAPIANTLEPPPDGLQWHKPSGSGPQRSYPCHSVLPGPLTRRPDPDPPAVRRIQSSGRLTVSENPRRVSEASFALLPAKGPHQSRPPEQSRRHVGLAPHRIPPAPVRQLGRSQPSQSPFNPPGILLPGCADPNASTATAVERALEESSPSHHPCRFLSPNNCPRAASPARATRSNNFVADHSRPHLTRFWKSENGKLSLDTKDAV